MKKRKEILLQQKERLARKQKEPDDAKEVLEIKLKNYLSADVYAEKTDLSCVNLQGKNNRIQEVNMNHLKIVAVITAKAEFRSQIAEALGTVAEASRQEAGNISYVLHESAGNPLKFTILEEWESQDAIDFHNSTEHFLAFAAAVEGKTDSLDIDVIREMR